MPNVENLMSIALFIFFFRQQQFSKQKFEAVGSESFPTKSRPELVPNHPRALPWAGLYGTIGIRHFVRKSFLDFLFAKYAKAELLLPQL